ncbi:hypothetical protein GCM10009839_04150 [Catenulispora yoronensis]|uniref:Uncharacterized protein n=1 Tax=Catenulispora yoronensis TaxID=450799 RepID=A0ABP5F4P7_9ACTN
MLGSPGTLAWYDHPAELVATAFGAAAAPGALDEPAALVELDAVVVGLPDVPVAEPLAGPLVAVFAAPAGAPRSAGFWLLEQPAAASSRPAPRTAMSPLFTRFRFMSTTFDSPVVVYGFASSRFVVSRCVSSCRVVS